MSADRKSRRKHERYEIQCPVVFFWTDADGIRRAVEGYTRNLAVNGAFIMASDCPPLHSIVQFEIRLSEPSGGGRGLRVESTGEVLRIDTDGIPGFAVHGSREFRVIKVRNHAANGKMVA